MTTWLACTHRITCQRVADGCGIGLRMLAVFKGTAAISSTFRIRRGRIPVYSSQAWPGLIKFQHISWSSSFSTTRLLRLLRSVSMVSVLLVSLWRRWWISRPACWMVARISNCRNCCKNWKSRNEFNEFVWIRDCESLWVPQFLVSYVSLCFFDFFASFCIPILIPHVFTLHPGVSYTSIHHPVRKMYIPQHVPHEKRLFPGGENYRKYASWYATGYPNELEHYSLEGNTTWNSTWKQQRRREYVCAMVA